MRINNEIKLDFRDVLIEPKRSTIESRKQVILERTFKFKYSGYEWTGVPIISANMDTTGTMAMAKALAKHRMMTALHKFYDVNTLAKFFIDNHDIWDYIFYTVGIKDEDLQKLSKVAEIVNADAEKNGYWKRFPHMLCVDVANGYTERFDQTLRDIRVKYPTTTIMAGNVVTPNMAEQLIQEAKVDIVKVGIGPGSVCTTRLMTGVGYPQLSAVIECSDAAHGIGGQICSDGGCSVPGDICKAFGGGADFVMLGGMFAGTDECEGEWEYEDGSCCLPKYERDPAAIAHIIARGSNLSSLYEGEEVKPIEPQKAFLKFYGMSSKAANNKYNGGLSTYKAAEGKEVKIAYKGSVDEVVQQIVGGLKSACSYVGATRLKDLPKCCTFNRVAHESNEIFGKNR